MLRRRPRSDAGESGGSAEGDLEQEVQGMAELTNAVDELRASVEEELARLRGRDLLLEERLDELEAAKGADTRAEPADPQSPDDVVEGEVPWVSQPLVLICDAMAPLGREASLPFDGHPDLYLLSEPLLGNDSGELSWPELDLSRRPKSWLRALGFDQRTDGASPQRELFLRLVKARPVKTRREAIECTLGVRLDSAGAGLGKRWVLAYAPGIPLGAARRGFERDYPDGRLVVCFGGPALLAGAEQAAKGDDWDLTAVVDRWQQLAVQVLSTLSLDDRRAFLVMLDDFSRDPARVVAGLSAFMGIEQPAEVAPSAELRTIAESAARLDEGRLRALEESSAPLAEQIRALVRY